MHPLVLTSLIIGGFNILLAGFGIYYLARLYLGARNKRCPRDSALHQWSVMLCFAFVGYILNEARWIWLMTLDHASAHAVDEVTWVALETCWLAGTALLARSIVLRECDLPRCGHHNHVPDEQARETPRT